eukprot:6135090-Alexandrium_andersonii.AAC.1
MTAASAQARGNTKWAKQHSVSKVALRIAPRQDRCLLVALYEDGQQIVAIKCEKYGDDRSLK